MYNWRIGRSLYRIPRGFLNNLAILEYLQNNGATVHFFFLAIRLKIIIDTGHFHLTIILAHSVDVVQFSKQPGVFRLI